MHADGSYRRHSPRTIVRSAQAKLLAELAAAT
jgi:hypothetical protein